MFFIGLISGAVIVSGAADSLDWTHTLIFAAASGMIIPGLVVAMDRIGWKDPLAVGPVHGIAGLLGTIGAAFGEYGDGFLSAEVSTEEARVLAAVAAAIHRRYQDRIALAAPQAYRQSRPVTEAWTVLLGDKWLPVEIETAGNAFEVRQAGGSYLVDSRWELGQPVFHGSLNQTPIAVKVERRGAGYRLARAGAVVDV